MGEDGDSDARDDKTLSREEAARKAKRGGIIQAAAVPNVALFESAVEACRPASFTTGPDDRRIEYRVVGLQDGGCAIRRNVVSHPKDNLVLLSMTCVYDRDTSFDQIRNETLEEASQGDCTGPLLEALR